MSDDPGSPGRPGNEPGDESSDHTPQNPFKGTPFEALFAGGMPDLAKMFGQSGQPGQTPDFSAILGQLQAFLKPPAEGFINWETVLDIARKSAAQSADPSPSDQHKHAVADALRLADHWLDTATELPSGVTTPVAWSRAEWIVGTVEVWKVLVEPVAAQATTALSQALPEEARAAVGPLIGLLGQATGAMVAQQVGTALGGLAGEMLTASDIGLPLGPAGKAALLPVNIATFADGIDVGYDDVLLYLALREAAHQRLFANVPWLREHLIGAVRDYASGIEIDTGAIEQQVRGLDPNDMNAMQEAMNGGLFELADTPQQRAALTRLEVTLALVEGWVDEVVGQASLERMPSAAKLQEAVRRRRAAGGPAEQTFASLVGLELRPRRLRDASTLWGSLRNRQGAEARDGVWMHPDLLPTAADLDDPLGFREEAAAPEAMSAEEFDAGLADLLDGKAGGAPEPDPDGNE